MIRFLLLSCLLIGVAVCQQDSYSCELSPNFSERNGYLIRDVYRGCRTHFDLYEFCLLDQCQCNKPCAVAYNRKTGVCIGANQELFEMAVKVGIPFYAPTGDKDWVTYISAGVTIRNGGPPAFWLLDSLSRGRNLGSRLYGLDMNVKGLTFPSVGPRGAKSKGRFAKFTTQNRAYVQLQRANKYFLKLNHHFTMAAWVKRSRLTNQGIVDSYYGVVPALRSRDNAPHLWLLYSNSLILHLQRNVHAYTTKQFHKKLSKWIHVAVTYAGKGRAHFYVDGVRQGLQKNLYQHASGTILQPRFIEIGRRGTASFLNGNMACLAIYERVLSQSEIRRLRDSCP